MASFSSFFTTKKFPSVKTIRALLAGPLTSLAILVYGIFFALCAAVFALLIVINNHFLVTVPASGGTLTEGVVGAPHFINPLLATTPTDQRLTALVYSGLMHVNDDGSISNDLVQNYTVSPDGLTYTFSLPTNSKFSDGMPLTSGDIAFTVTELQDSTISTQSGYWQNISVATPDPQTVVFTLPAADTTFLSHLNFGILPKHVWGTIGDASFATAAQNLHPIGSGLMNISSIKYQSGLPTTVVLTRNKYATNKTLLDGLTLQTFANQSLLADAINSGDIDFSYAITPDTLSDTALAHGLTATAVPTARVVSIYRSSSDKVLSGTTVAWLNQIIDKNAIVATVEDGYGTPAGGLSYSLADAGLPANTATVLKGFSLAVQNDSDVLVAAQAIAQQLSRQGIFVSVNAFDPGTFQQALNSGSISLFIAEDGQGNDSTIPSQYNATIPLYGESVPYIFNTTTHTIPPATFQSPAIEYEHLQDWYTRTNKLWKWFIRKQ